MNYGASSGGGQSIAQPRVSHETSTARLDNLTATIGELDPILDRLDRMGHGIEQLADKVGGTGPQPLNEPKGPDTPPHSMVDNLHRKIMALDYLLNRADNHLNRLGRSLGE